MGPGVDDKSTVDWSLVAMAAVMVAPISFLLAQLL